MAEKTHREIRLPTVPARFLADYMGASETAKRTIVSGCKYQTLARVFQHDEARLAVSRFIRSGSGDVKTLSDKASELRLRLADTEFERSQLDVNADYITQFSTVSAELHLPTADIEATGKAQSLEINGVKVNPQIAFRLRRQTRTNRVMVGAGALRYAKGAPLKADIAQWQSSFLHGYLKATMPEAEVTPELKLCVTIDAFTGVTHAAPSDAIRRFNNIAAACASIAERWPNIAPPKGAIF